MKNSYDVMHHSIFQSSWNTISIYTSSLHCATQKLYRPPIDFFNETIMSKHLATLIGFSAILQWSTLVGLLKKISFSIGADWAVLLMYSLSTVILLLIFKIPNLKRVPPIYLISGTLLFLI